MLKGRYVHLMPIFCKLVYKATNEFQVLRELVNNSYNSNASAIQIRYWLSSDGLCIEFLDNGIGMSEKELKQFFTIQDEKEDRFDVDTSILMNCRCIDIWTGKKNESGRHFRLSSIFEKYDAMFIDNGSETQIDKCEELQGTKILITGYNLDNINNYYTGNYIDEADFIKRIYNYRRVEDYLIWRTLIGNRRKLFWHELIKEEICEEYLNYQPEVTIHDDINHKTIKLNTPAIGFNEMFEGGNEYLGNNKTDVYKRSGNMCYSFKKHHIFECIKGKYYSFFLYGYVAGENYRLSSSYLGMGEKLSDRFGIYLAKDFVPFKKIDNLVDDINLEHFKIVINSEHFKLSLNKTDITNINSEEVRWILKKSREIINGEMLNEAYDNYFRLRAEEEFEHRNRYILKE